MAKKTKCEEMDKVKGARRPLLGAFLIFIGIIFAMAAFDYKPGQEIFFRDSVFGFLSSTSESLGSNICGRLGATITAFGLWLFGCAYYMIVVLCLWTSLLCFKRSPRLLSCSGKVCMPLMVFSLAVLGAILQRAFNPSVGIESFSSSYFRNGWGGIIALPLFEKFLKPIINVAGCALLFSALYFACLIVVFVEQPSVLAKNVWELLKKTPAALAAFTMWLLKFLRSAILFLLRAPRKISQKEDGESASPLFDKNEVDLQNPFGEVVSDDGESQQMQPQQDSNVQEQEAFPFVEQAQEMQNPESGEQVLQNPFEQEGSFAQFENNTFVPEQPLENPETNNSFEPFSFEGEAQNQEVESNAESASIQPEGILEPISEQPHQLPEHGGIDNDKFFEVSPQVEPEIEPEEQPAQKVAALTQKPKSAAEKKEALNIEYFKPVDIVEPRKEDIKKGDYVFPSLDLLASPPEHIEGGEDYQGRMDEIIKVLETFSIKVTPATVQTGPVITRYEVKPAPGVRLSRILSLEKDIALGMAAEKVRVIAPVPGKGTVGIEVPNKNRQGVFIKDILQSPAWHNSKAEIPIALGKDVTGQPIVLDLAKMPHALIAGSTGSGKSVCMNSIIASMLYHLTPEDVRFIMVDPKVVELQVYNALPHMLVPVITDPKRVPAALKWLVSEMKNRYEIFSKCQVRNIAAFNAKILKDHREAEKAKEFEASLTPEERSEIASMQEENSSTDEDEIKIPDTKLPYIVCIIDELADLMMVAGKEVEALIMRLTQVGRAAGVHLLVATQRPSTNVITGVIKANLPTRIAFRVAALVDSRTILDAKGAEMLIGTGDMLFVPPGASDPVRAQGAFLSDQEIVSIVDALKVNGEPQYVQEIQDHLDSALEGEDGSGDDDTDNSGDPLVPKAIEVIRTNKKASISFLQRKLQIGYNRSARIMEILEERGVVGPEKGPSTPRDIYL